MFIFLWMKKKGRKEKKTKGERDYISSFGVCLLFFFFTLGEKDKEKGGTDKGEKKLW